MKWDKQLNKQKQLKLLAFSETIEIIWKGRESAPRKRQRSTPDPDIARTARPLTLILHVQLDPWPWYCTYSSTPDPDIARTARPLTLILHAQLDPWPWYCTYSSTPDPARTARPLTLILHVQLNPCHQTSAPTKCPPPPPPLIIR